MQAVIMAGGRGTRLRGVTGDALPKPMASVAGRPILEWQLRTLRENGVTDAILVVGYLGGVIRDYFRDGGDFGLRITYFDEKEPLGTAGALALLRARLEEEVLLLLGDVIFDIDLARMERFHRDRGARATLFVHPNTHPFDSDLIVADAARRVRGLLFKGAPRHGWYDNCVNAGLYLFQSDAFQSLRSGASADMEKDLLLPMIERGEAVYAYHSPEYVKDVGTPQRLAAAGREIQSGFVAARCLKRPQKCIFLDRDGTLGRWRGFVSRAEDFELEPCAAQAVREINASGYLAAVVTNQPVVARGLCTEDGVRTIHRKMETLLGHESAYLDGVYFCPHHPDKGYPEENPAYKIACACRKPGTGMIRACADAYNIDLAQSWIVGDTTTDIQTGRNAGLHTALVLTGEAGRDGKYDAAPDLVAENLLDAVRRIIEKERT